MPRLPSLPLRRTPPGRGRIPKIRTPKEPESRLGPRKIGVIDVGSNTSRLIILAHTPGVSFRLIDQVREQVRLSEGMGAEGLLRAQPMERTIRLLRVFGDSARRTASTPSWPWEPAPYAMPATRPSS